MAAMLEKLCILLQHYSSELEIISYSKDIDRLTSATAINCLTREARFLESSLLRMTEITQSAT